MASDYLLDTHTFLWLSMGDSRLGTEARGAILDSDQRLVLSVVSIWEMAIKISLGKLEVGLSLGSLVREQVELNSLTLMDIRADHALRVRELPWIHRDPFDRLLVSQALVEDLILLSRDEVLDGYAVRRVW